MLFRGPRSLGLVLTSGLSLLVVVQSQNAACVDSAYQWSDNSLGQDPCTMASYLGGVCSAGTFTIPKLPTNADTYLGPPVGDGANSCRCSSVFYSVLSACAACQDHTWLRWSKYNENCSTVHLKTFNDSIPTGTRIPQWAYADVSVGDIFNPNTSSSIVGPESSGVPAPTSAVNTPSALASPSASTTTDAPHRSNAGAIAGGVIGGLVLLCLIIILTFWLVRRRKNRQPPSALVEIDPSLTMSTASTNRNLRYTSNKLYDPNDPSTFPPKNISSPSPSPPVSAYYSNISSPPPTTGHHAGRHSVWSSTSSTPAMETTLAPNRFAAEL